MASDHAPVMAVHTRGSGPDLVLFHGGMGCWQHWVRNIAPLSEHFTVHELDHPSYGASASVPRDMQGAEYLDLVHRTMLEMFPGEAPLRHNTATLVPISARGGDEPQGGVCHAGARLASPAQPAGPARASPVGLPGEDGDRPRRRAHHLPHQVAPPGLPK